MLACIRVKRASTSFNIAETHSVNEFNPALIN